MKKKKTKKQIIKLMQQKETEFTILSIIAVLILLISSSYAIFSSVQKAQKYTSLKVGSLVIDFNDTDEGMGNVINLNGTYPSTDEDGQKTTPYVFKIKNTGTVAASYTIKLQDDTDMITEDKCESIQLDKSKLKYSIDGKTAELLSTKYNNNYTIITGTLAGGESKSYSLRTWIDGDAGNEVLGKHYHGKIVVEGINISNYVKNNMILYYDSLDHGTTDNVWKDLSDNKNDGIMSGFSSDTNNGWSTNYLKFDGIDDSIVTKNDVVYNSNKITIEFTDIDGEILENTKEDQAFVLLESSENYNENKNGYLFLAADYRNENSNPYFSVNTNGYNRKFINDNFTSNKVNDYTIIVNNEEEAKEQIKIYVNGELYETSTQQENTTITGIINSYKLYIGARNNSELYSRINLASLRIYNTALTASQIKSNYLIDKQRYE